MVSRSQRQRRLARAKWQRQELRRQERVRRRRRRSIIVGAALAVLLVAGGTTLIVWLAGDSGDPAQAADQPEPTSSPTPEPDAAGGECLYLENKPDEGEPEPAGYGRPQATPDPRWASDAGVTARLTTSAGELEVELDNAGAPCAVNSLAFLADQNAYADGECDVLTVEPAAAKYLECGEPTGPGYYYAAETTATDVPAGSLVLATTEDANDSRIRLTYADSTFDDPVTVLGRVTKGTDLLEGIADAGLADDSESDPKASGGKQGETAGEMGRPKEPIGIEKLEVTANTS